MTRIVAASDLHQHAAKWELLVEDVVALTPDAVLIAGDILPKYGGFPGPQGQTEKIENGCHFVRPIPDMTSQKLC